MIAVVKYNAGNTTSVVNALQRLGVEAKVTDQSVEIQEAEKVIFPGVGEASSAIRYLQEKGLDTVLKTLTQPVLGICLGMQLMGQQLEEGDTVGLGLFPLGVKRFPPDDKVPHMGWNNLITARGTLFEGIDQEADFYFVHSYFMENGPETIATCDYGIAFTAAVQYQNYYGTQFHPEKSGEAGAQVLQNFLKL